MPALALKTHATPIHRGLLKISGAGWLAGVHMPVL